MKNKLPDFQNSDVFSFAWLSFSITFWNMDIYHLLQYQYTYRHTIYRTTILEVIFTLFLPSTLLVILQPSDSNLNQGIVAQLY